MDVSVTLDISMPPQAHHATAMRRSALVLTDDPASVRVRRSTTSPTRICAHFTVPDARQVDVVDRIARQFWLVEDYQDLSIGFTRRGARRTGRSIKSQAVP